MAPEHGRLGNVLTVAAREDQRSDSARPVSNYTVARGWLLVAAVALAAVADACASAPAKPDPAIAVLARADAALLEGCYDCLLEARDAYAQVAVGVRRSESCPGSSRRSC